MQLSSKLFCFSWHGELAYMKLRAVWDRAKWEGACGSFSGWKRKEITS